jgi:hypothetical protein
MDGNNEVSLCTYGQMLLVYKLTSTESAISEGDFSASSGVELLHKAIYAYPLLGIKCIDITGDGVLEMILVSVKGLLVLQHDLKDVAELLVEKLTKLKKLYITELENK